MQTLVSAIFLDKHGNCGGPWTNIADVSQVEAVRLFPESFQYQQSHRLSTTVPLTGTVAKPNLHGIERCPALQAGRKPSETTGLVGVY